MKNNRITHRFSGLLWMTALVTMTSPALAAPPVSFTDIAPFPGVGLDSYERTPSARHALYTQFMQDSLTTPFQVADVVNTPMRHRGIPGVSILDFDGDGDLDVYVTNGPGTANSLYSNQLVETGSMTFVDVAGWAGVEATSQDSNGSCFGDIDNDGDHDLMVVGHESAPILYENNGGTFTDISASAQIDSGLYGMSCVMGDINQDGLLDIFVARGYSLDTLEECFFDIFDPDIKPNDMFLNQGNNTFADVSDSSGIRDLASGGMPPGLNTITWSGALVDYDLDGDLDLFTTDDQCNFPGSAFGGFARGTMQLFKNDGTGHFTNHTLQAGLSLPSEWMGTSWGDFNHDGAMDFFVTSFGEWGKQFVGAPIRLGDETSRWYLGDHQGAFIDPGVGNLLYNPFGWGTVAEDFDNDGHTDIGFYGGLDMLTLIDRANPGAIIFNDGQANFTYEPESVNESHRRRNDSGMAAGDLDQDGFVDIVSVSNFDTPEPLPLVPFGVGGIDYGTVWDPAFFVPVATESNGDWTWNGITFPNGTLSVEVNNGESQNESVKITAVGSKGFTSLATNNRDGIGAVMTFTPKQGDTAMKPVLGGSSHASQDSLEIIFGMGTAQKGTLEVLWPGGVRNRLYNVKAGKAITMPEIPCSYDDASLSQKQYKRCVKKALKDLVDCDVITKKESKKLFSSAMRARKNP